MSDVAAFEAQLRKLGDRKFATWHKIDLHNHSPSSHDYQGDRAKASDDTVERIRQTDLSVVMFTDHGKLPTKEFADDVAKRSGKVIIRGTELNVFVDAWFKPKNKVDSQPFFHLLVGFDPDGEYGPDFWLDKLYLECGREERLIGSEKIVGVKSGIERIVEVLRSAGALLIPAHLHSQPDAFRSRSLDDIYADPTFLAFAPRFDALEVTDTKTAEFFDGKHKETNNLVMSCIRSSDAHAASKLGMRPTWIQMQSASFSELKAALEFRSRICLEEPPQPDSYVVGMHVQGNYLKNFWLPLSPGCNVFIGVKGSGKTAALECLRFVLGTEVPKASRGQVTAHLTHILGPNGRVRALLRRRDGTKVLIERAMANPDRFQVTFDNGRVEMFAQVSAVNFPLQILGWHEIEHAATDSGLRRRYLDEIAGQHQVQTLLTQADAKAAEVRSLHEQASNRYQSFKTLNKQVDTQEQLRRGLQELTDAKLVELKGQYELALSHQQEMRELLRQAKTFKQEQTDKIVGLFPFRPPVLAGESPLEAAAATLRAEVARIYALAGAISKQLDEELAKGEKVISDAVSAAESRFGGFSQEYQTAVQQLQPEQRRLLESHQQVLELTRELPNLVAQRDKARKDVEGQLHQLIGLCGEIVSLLEKRTDTRQQAVKRFTDELKATGVRVEIKSFQLGDSYQEYSSRYRSGYEVIDALEKYAQTERTLHSRLRRVYTEALADLAASEKYLVFDRPEFSNYLGLFEEDDLAITFDVDGTGQTFRPIDQLSAGQRCTAMFPILLRLREGPLVIDQPEDNLDNRHIAGMISPVILDDKRVRQMIFTSHNANLVVLGDPENIVVFEGKATEGRAAAQGFLAARQSSITQHVLDILDGGERALEMRYRKYGSKQRP